MFWSRRHLRGTRPRYLRQLTQVAPVRANFVTLNPFQIRQICSGISIADDASLHCTISFDGLGNHSSGLFSRPSFFKTKFAKASVAAPSSSRMAFLCSGSVIVSSAARADLMRSTSLPWSSSDSSPSLISLQMLNLLAGDEPVFRNYSANGRECLPGCGRSSRAIRACITPRTGV